MPDATDPYTVEEWMRIILADCANPADEGHPLVMEPWLHEPVTWVKGKAPDWMVDLWLDIIYGPY